MNGLIFAELKKFVEVRLGAAAWPNLVQAAGVPNRMYIAAREHPDEELVKLVVTASATTGIPVDDLLTDFGAFIVPDLLQLYGALLDPEWRTIDVIERTEHTIHGAVRLRSPAASPPVLATTRTSARSVRVEYHSSRKLCSVAKGIVRGIAQHFDESVTIEEVTCMKEGGAACDLRITLDAA